VTQCIGTNQPWGSRCSRDAVEEIAGRWYCRPHAAGLRRRLANSERIDLQIAADKVTRDRVFTQADWLSAALGITVEPHYDAFGKRDYTGKMVVSAVFLTKIAGITLDE